MAGMQSPNVAAMGAVPQPHPPPMSGQQAPQAQVQPQPAPQQQTQQAPDAITKVKVTVNKLKESLRVNKCFKFYKTFIEQSLPIFMYIQIEDANLIIEHFVQAEFPEMTKISYFSTASGSEKVKLA